MAASRLSSTAAPLAMMLRRACLLLSASLVLAAANLRAINPEDAVLFDNTTAPGSISVVNGGLSGTAGAVTTVASSTVGTGVAFHAPMQGCVSPSQKLYYWDPVLLAFVSVDLTNASYPRTLVPVPTNVALVPGNAQFTYGPQIVWDYSTNTILYVDNGAGSAKSTIARGIYRLNPATGTNTLFAAYPSGAVNAIALKQDASALYVFNQNGNTFGLNASVSQIATDGTLTVVDGGPALYGAAAAQPRYYQATGISWDIINQAINLYDEGNDQTTSRIIRINPAAGTRSFIANGSAGPAATAGGTVFNVPTTGFTNTAGRIVYTDGSVDLSKKFLAFISGGSPVATRLGSTDFAQNSYIVAYVPPSPPVITSPTATTTGTAATLGATVTSAGTAFVTPTIQTRGVVYSQTSANANPQVGGTGVTQSAATTGTGAYTVSVSGLNPGTQYSYAGYVSTFYGLVYTAVGTFTTPNLPTVVSPTATAITGTSATLGGNVSSDGGSTVTARGVVVSTTANNGNPVIGQSGVLNFTTTGMTGVFTVGATNLAVGTAYTYRAYATNAVGTTYTAAANFTTASPPTANAQTVAVAFNTPKAITLTGSDPNTPAQTLTFNVVTAPTHGTLSGIAPNLTYTPTNGYNGADSFTFTTTNTAGLTSSAATVTLNVAPGTPTANAQSVNVAFNTAAAVTLTATDPDSPALALTYTVLTQPTHGTLSGTAPNLTYTPTANYQGADSFTFRVSNGTNTSNTATVSLTVAAGTPTANAQSISTAFNTATAVTLTGTDPDSPALALTYTVATAPARGTLSGTAPNLTYTPSANTQGVDSFTFTVSNGQKTSPAATVTITVAAGTPTATAQSVNAYLNQPRAITLAGTDPDVPALPLTYTVATAPAHGTLSGTAPNLTYTPASGFSGADSFTFTVSNGQNTSAVATVSITVQGDPVITGFTASGAVGSVVTFTGSQFTGATGVTFFRNVAAASFTVVSDTQLTVSVPGGATTGTLRVTTPAGTTTTPTKFTVTP